MLTRRGLLGAGLAGLAAQGTAVAWGPDDLTAELQRRKKDCVPANQIERLERDVRSLASQVKGLAARLAGSGFGPATVQLVAAISDVTSFPHTLAYRAVMAFPGSIVGLSVVVETAYAGVAGSDYVDFEVYNNAGATGFGLRLAGGSASNYALQGKGIDVFAAGDVLTLVATGHTGTPLGGGKDHYANIWVSLT